MVVMNNFIEVHDKQNTIHLINLACVEQIINFDNEVAIYFAFQENEAYSQDFIKVMETYEEIINKIYKEVS